MTDRIPFYAHDLGEAELQEIAKVFAGPILTTGDTVLQFERLFAERLGRRHALGVTSCTGALHMALLALGIGPGDEVITTPLTFVATATAILEAGATPVFVDVEEDTGNLDARLVEAAITAKTRAIMPVHLYGLMCDMTAIQRVARAHDLAIIEDAAHCVEGVRDGYRPGELSNAACFSFYATKNLTCGEGGALVTDSDEMLTKLSLLRLHGMTKTAADRQREGYTHWDVLSLGWKYNLDNIQAAILLPQLQRLESKLARRHELAAAYETELASLANVRAMASRPGAVHARHLFPVRIAGDRRDEVVQKLEAAGVRTVVNYRAIHLLTYLQEKLGYHRGDFPIAERVGDEVLSLPFYPTMPDDSVSRVVASLRDVLQS